MSFTQIVKEEVLHKAVSKSREKDMEMYAILKTKKAILSNRVEIKLENIGLAKRVYSYFKEETDLKFSIKYSISKHFGEHKVYYIIVPKQPELKKLLEKLNKLEETELLNSDSRLRGYIRGMFLACGYIKSPEKEYAMDFFVESEFQAYKLENILRKLEKRVFHTIKKNKNLVYLRNSEDIMDILILIGAKHAFFQYEEVTVVKEIKNKTIRSINWEVANETKLLNAAQKQIKMINYIKDKDRFKDLTSTLQQTAEMRLENTELSLLELANLSGLSKSGIRNRFRRIENFYKKLKEDSQE